MADWFGLRSRRWPYSSRIGRRLTRSSLSILRTTSRQPPPYPGSTAFIVPVEITGAVQLTSWQFSLSFDPTDVQINTSCDPTTDTFCDPLFGPVTQGPFFSSVALFPPFFDPGFIFNGSGLLDAV